MKILKTNPDILWAIALILVVSASPIRTGFSYTYGIIYTLKTGNEYIAPKDKKEILKLKIELETLKNAKLFKEPSK